MFARHGGVGINRTRKHKNNHHLKSSTRRNTRKIHGRTDKDKNRGESLDAGEDGKLRRTTCPMPLPPASAAAPATCKHIFSNYSRSSEERNENTTERTNWKQKQEVVVVFIATDPF